MRAKGLEGGKIMYTEEGVVIGAFAGIITLLFITSLIF
jgi:hypothetical protein